LSRGALGRISAVTTKQNSGAPVVNIVSSVGYEPFGPLNAASYGNGVALAQGYDQDYELTSIAAAAGTANVQNLSYSYDPSGNTGTVNPTTTGAENRHQARRVLARERRASERPKIYSLSSDCCHHYGA